MRISDWSSDVCSSDLEVQPDPPKPARSGLFCPSSSGQHGRDQLVRKSENGFVADTPLEYGFWLLLALVLAHAGAAFRHHIFQGDDTLRHMPPVPRRACPVSTHVKLRPAPCSRRPPVAPPIH